MPAQSASSRAERIYGDLLADITLRRRTPGFRAVEVEVAQGFDVSRTPVRQALGPLESKGLTASGLSGFTILAPSPTDIREIFEIRRALEALGLSRVVAMANGNDDAEFGQLFDAIKAAESIRQTTEANVAFRAFWVDRLPNA